MKLLNTDPQAVEFNPSCSGQAHSNKHGIGPRYENTLPGCILAVLCVPFIFHLLRSVDAKSGKVVLKVSSELAQTGVYILISLGEHQRTHVKYHTGYDQGTEIHSKPRRMLLLVGEAQLAGCLKLWVVACEVGRRHLMTMCKALFRTLYIRRV